MVQGSIEALTKEELLQLYRVARKINSIEDLKQLLSEVMDIAIETVGAERGFLVLLEGDEISVRVARGMDKEDVENPEEISYTILKEVVKTKKPVLTANAKSDPRFSGAQSVLLYNILSIVAVPLIKKGRLVGVIYLDSRTQKRTFTEHDLLFLSSFADLAAIAIENAEAREKLELENIRLRGVLGEKFGRASIVGKSKALMEVMEMVERVKLTDVPVLLEGESGVGKELIARYIHFTGPRRKGPFVPIYCGAFPETLLESELFGYKKGAFTGAVEDKKGLFEEADGGTFFLDEVSEIPAGVQVKLLRVLEEGKFRRLGETKERQVDVRIISATNRILEHEVTEGRFRQDLYYRLKVVKIRIPPLRERREDIPLLVEHFLELFTGGEKKITPRALEALMEYDWPGNVRELENTISYAVVMCRDDKIDVKHLPPEISGEVIHTEKPRTLREIEREAIIQALASTGGNKKKAAELLGISTKTLYNKIKEYGL